jgi:WD40 repeat protein
MELMRSASVAAVAGSPAVSACAALPARRSGRPALPSTPPLTLATVAAVAGLCWAIEAHPAPPARAETPPAQKTAAQESPREQPLRRFGTTNLRNCSAAFAFAPDGSSLAVVPNTPQDWALLHDCRTGALLGKVPAGTAARGLGFSPDGKRLLIWDAQEQTTIWNVATGKKLKTIEGHSACFVDQGRKIVTTIGTNLRQEEPQVLAIFDATTLARLGTARYPGGLILSRPLEPTHSARQEDGKWIVATHPEGKVVFSVAGGEQARYGGFHKDGELFIFSNADGIHIWNVKTAQKVRSLAVRTNSPLVLSPDGKQLAWSGFDSHDGIAFVWVCDLADGKPRHVGAATNAFHAPLYSPDGKTLAFRTDADALVLRDTVTGKDVIQAGHTGQIGRVQFTADGKHLVSRDRDAILIWELHSGKCTRRFPDDLPAGELPIVGTLARDFVITVAADGTLRQRELVTGGEIRVLEGKHGFVFGAALPAAVSADASVLALVSKDYHIRAYELATGKVLLDFDTPCAVWSLALAPDGRFVSWTSQNHPRGDGVPHYLEVTTGREVERQQLPASAFPLGNDVAHWLPVADFKARLPDLKLARPWGGLSPDEADLRRIRLALSRDGRLLLARTLDRVGAPDETDLRQDPALKIGSLKIWEIASGRLLPPLAVRRDSTEVAVLDAGGRMLVTTTYAGRIDLWELATGKKRLTLAGHHAAVYALAFSPDGRYLVSGGGDAQVLLWDLWGR